LLGQVSAVPESSALLTFAGVVVTAAGGIAGAMILARRRDRNSDGDDPLVKILLRLDELEERVGTLERRRGGPRPA
jgi:hypothetical protein